MDWHTVAALTAYRQVELARDAALIRAGQTARNRKARTCVDDGHAKARRIRYLGTGG